jgi:asparagine synthase (glutamine-hydrolysing)
VVNDNFEHYIDKYYLFWQRLIPNSQIRQVFDPIWDEVKEVWTRDIFRDVFRHHANELTRPEDYVNHSLYFEAKTFLHGLLVVEDKLSMAHSLETRVPFLDNDLVDFSMRVPVSLKLDNLQNVVRMNENEPGSKTSKFYERNKDGKKILRDAMRKYIPDVTANAEKQGFSAPDASWFRGESIEYVKRTLLADSALVYKLMDREAVLRILNEHLSGNGNHRLFIWSMLSIECMLQNG